MGLKVPREFIDCIQCAAKRGLRAESASRSEVLKSCGSPGSRVIVEQSPRASPGLWQDFPRLHRATSCLGKPHHCLLAEPFQDFRTLLRGEQTS